MCSTLQVGSTLEADPRLSLMQKTWFEGKDVIDVGCNEGHVTISLGIPCPSFESAFYSFSVFWVLVFKALLRDYTLKGQAVQMFL